MISITRTFFFTVGQNNFGNKIPSVHESLVVVFVVLFFSLFCHCLNKWFFPLLHVLFHVTTTHIKPCYYVYYEHISSRSVTFFCQLVYPFFSKVLNLISDTLWNFKQHEKLVMSMGGDEKRRIGGGVTSQ